MEYLQSLDQLIENWISSNKTTFVIMLIIVSLWQGVWKLLALWFAARKNDIAWFIIMWLVNLLGIIEIIYLATQTNFFKKFYRNE